MVQMTFLNIIEKTEPNLDIAETLIKVSIIMLLIRERNRYNIYETDVNPTPFLNQSSLYIFILMVLLTGCHMWAQSGSDRPQMWQMWDFFRSEVNFASQNVLNLIWEVPDLYHLRPIWSSLLPNVTCMLCREWLYVYWMSYMSDLCRPRRHALALGQSLLFH